MQPNVELSLDPIRTENLPATDGMELDYRTNPFTAKQVYGRLAYVLTAFAVGGVLSTIGLRSLGVYLASPLFLALAVLLCGSIAVYLYLRGDPPTVFGPVALAGPVLWLLSNATDSRHQAALAVFSVLILTFFAHAVVTHFGFYLRADPYVGRELRRQWSEAWQPLIFWKDRKRLRLLLDPSEPAGESIYPLPLETLLEQKRYAESFKIVPIAFLLSALPMLLIHDGLIAGMLAVLTFLFVLLMFGCWHIRQAGTVSVRQAMAHVARAVVNYLTYNMHDTRAPGVFRSPAGSYLQRNTLTGLTILFVGLAVLPMAAYFPVGYALGGRQAWARAATNQWGWEEVFQSKKKRPTPSSTSSEPSGLDNFYMAQLTDRQRAAYRRDLSEAQAAEANYREGMGRLQSRPEAVLVALLREATRGNAGFIFGLITSVVCGLLVPVVLLFAMCFALGSRTIAHFVQTFEQPSIGHDILQERGPDCSLWEAMTHRLRASTFQTADAQGKKTRERDLVLAGFNATHDYPVLLEPDVLAEHAHITGDTGSGKSSLGIAPMLAQLVGRPDTSVIVLDLKGDRALFETARQAVEEANARRKSKYHIRFRWFTNRLNQSTYAFNPFLQTHMKEVTQQQKTAILLQSLGLDYGEDYGQSYYSSVHRTILAKTLDHDPTISSFARLKKFFDSDLRTVATDLNIDKKTSQDASHLQAVVDALASFAPLNVTPESEVHVDVLKHQIDMARVVRRPYVVYFSLPSSLEQKSVSEIAKLALHSALTAAVLRGASKHQVYLFVDEFQQVVSHDLEIVLRQARSLGISMILANQTLDDLKRGTANLIPTVQANTRLKQIFSAADLDQQDALIKGSGETIYELLSAKLNADGEPVHLTANQNIGPRLRRNDIIEISDRPLHSLMHITRSRGVTQFGGFSFPVITPYHITFDEYERRMRTPWPAGGDATLTPGPNGHVVDSGIEAQIEASKLRERNEFDEKLEQIPLLKETA